MNAILWVLLIAGGFISGSLMFCKMIPKLLLHKDICELSDDGNPGAFNVFTHCGKGIGILCLSLDILKGFIPVFLASLFMPSGGFLFMLAVVAPVAGHATGIFNHFRGGKCIAVSFGVMAGIIPVNWVGFAVLALLYILFSTVLKIKCNRVRSITVYALYGIISGVVCAVSGYFAVSAACAVIALIAVLKHTKFVESFNKRRMSASEQ